MHEPSFLVAVDPEERAFRGAGHEVVALRVVAVPPARLDAFRAGEQLEVLLRGPPRRIEQPERPRARLDELARIPFAGLDAPPGVFGPMVGLRREAVDRRIAEPALQPLDELRP